MSGYYIYIFLWIFLGTSKYRHIVCVAQLSDLYLLHLPECYVVRFQLFLTFSHHFIWHYIKSQRARCASLFEPVPACEHVLIFHVLL